LFPSYFPKQNYSIFLMPEPLINIAIVDDHPVMLNGVRHLLTHHHHINICGGYQSGQALLAALKSVQPDVLLMDIQLPDIQGDELTKRIASQYPAIRILIFTTHNSLLLIRDCIQNGATGYMLKTEEENVLVTAIETVFRREEYFSPAIKDILTNDALARSRHTHVPELTVREKEILALIAGENTNQEIAQKLHLSTRTVENYRLVLMHKLDARNVVGLIKNAMRLGLYPSSH